LRLPVFDEPTRSSQLSLWAAMFCRTIVGQ